LYKHSWNYYTLSISVEEEARIKLKGKSLDESSTLDYNIENVKDMARLYYGKLWSEETERLYEKIEAKYLTRGAVKHHSSTFGIYIKGLGRYLLENFIPQKIGLALKNLPIDSVLLLDLDDAASMVPWELMNTDRNFLCLDYVLSRTRPRVLRARSGLGETVPMLLVSDPTGDLYGAQIEANSIINQLRGSNIRVKRYGSEITKNHYYNILKSGSFEIIHISGHSESDVRPGKCRHKFSGGELFGYEIGNLKGGKMPKLVFTNSCQSAESSLGYDDTGNTSLAGYYLDAGVDSCIAAIWLVSDVGASYFSSDFYRFILFGSTLGEALLKARRSAFKRWRLQDFIWGSYIFYGDPYLRLF
jgi:hypothetical protein